ncbi:MAG: hypothetical protein R2861_01905 [Desulfobacterales bacterium]
MDGIVRVDIFLQQHGGGHDGGEGIVDFMGNARGEPPDGHEFSCCIMFFWILISLVMSEDISNTPIISPFSIMG